MGSFCVVVGRPFFDALLSIGHRDEPRGVQALRAKTTIERLDEPVICWLSGPREVELDIAQIRPLVEHPVGELGAIVDPNAPRLAADARQSIQFLDHPTRPELCSRACRESFSRMAVDDRQDPERPTVEQPLGGSLRRRFCCARDGVHSSGTPNSRSSSFGPHIALRRKSHRELCRPRHFVGRVERPCLSHKPVTHIGVSRGRERLIAATLQWLSLGCGS